MKDVCRAYPCLKPLFLIFRLLKRPHRIVRPVILTLTLGTVVVFLWPAREPVHHGRTLSDWLPDYYGQAWIVRLGAVNPPTDEAIQHIGTNAIPQMLRRIVAYDSPRT